VLVSVRVSKRESDTVYISYNCVWIVLSFNYTLDKLIMFESNTYVVL